jgi:sec-independent protein translocase protein TatA
MPGGPEWLVILAIVLLLFGSTRLPALARSLGKSTGEFKKGLKGDEDPAAESKKAEKAEKVEKTED